jgi:2-polyprenyl-3-methyl-5-hydroxy-6-metoxy-1,4-benzoquinol methylase
MTRAVLPYKYESEGPNCAHDYVIKPILSFLPQRKDLKIIDLGCGNGYFASLLASLGHDVTGVDSSEAGIAIARRAYPTATYYCRSLYDNLLMIIDKNYDVAIASEVIEHLYDPRLFLKNAAALLKPGGVLILTTPYHGYLKNVIMALSGKMDQHFTVNWDCGHIKFYSVKTLSALVGELGFRNIKFSFAGRFPYLWKAMILCAEKGE